MRAVAELTGGIIRVFPGEGSKWAADYDLVLFFTGEGDVATLKGLRTSALTIAHQRAIFQCLRELGFTDARWTRHDADGKTTRAIEQKL